MESPEDLPRSRSLHAAFQALHAFRREQGRLPRPRAPVGPCPAPARPCRTPPPCRGLPSPLCLQADAERVLELARSLGARQGPLDEDIVRAFTSVSAGDLCPVAAVVGALAAQEALKVSGARSRWPWLSGGVWWPREGTCCLLGDAGSGSRAGAQ